MYPLIQTFIAPPPTYFIGKVLRDETTEKTSSFHKHD